MKFLVLARKPFGLKFISSLVLEVGEHASKSDLYVVSNKYPEGWWNDNKIIEYSKSTGLRFYAWEKKSELNNFLSDFLRENRVDVVILCQYGWLIPKHILQQANCVLNIHLSLLPKYRGWNSFSHSILNGDKSHGWTIHLASDQIDEGDILMQGVVPISEHENAYSLYMKTSENFLNSLPKIISTIENFFKGYVKTTPQNSVEASWYPKDSLADFKILSEDLGIDQTDLIARALYFPPHESPKQWIGNNLVPLIPEKKGDCGCSGCIIL